MNSHELTNDELRIEIARALEWEQVDGKYSLFFRVPRRFTPCLVPHWPTEIEDAYNLEAELETEEERDHYVYTLTHIVDEEIPQNVNPFDWGSDDTLWALIHATPRQRAEAFLTVKQKEKE